MANDRIANAIAVTCMGQLDKTESAETSSMQENDGGQEEDPVAQALALVRAEQSGYSFDPAVFDLEKFNFVKVNL